MPKLFASYLQQQDIANDKIIPDTFSSTACGLAKSNKR
jgi:hypothetical protein